MEEIKKEIKNLEKRAKNLENSVKPQEKSQRIRELEAKSMKNDFWSDVITAKKTMKKIDSPKLKRSLPKYLALEQQEKLLDYFDTRQGNRAMSPMIRKRDKALTMVLLDAGLRVSELCNIKIPDLDLPHNILKINGKGDKEAEVFLSDRVIKTLEYYIENVRPHLLRRGFIEKRSKVFCVRRYDKRAHGEKVFKNCESKEEAENALYEGLSGDRGYLFARDGEKKLDTRHIYRILYLAGKSLGFKVHPHLLRHTFASNLRRKGADLLLIKEALRHSDVSTTQIYAHISNERYKAEIGKYLNEEKSEDVPSVKSIRLVKGMTCTR